jgi:hypothetical protein
MPNTTTTTNIPDDCSCLCWLNDIFDDLPDDLADDADTHLMVACEKACRACVNKPGAAYCTRFLPDMIRGDVATLISMLRHESKRAWQEWEAVQPKLLEQRFDTRTQFHNFATSVFDYRYYNQLRVEVAFFADHRHMSSDDKDKCEHIYDSLSCVTDLLYRDDVRNLVDQLTGQN